MSDPNQGGGGDNQGGGKNKGGGGGGAKEGITLTGNINAATMGVSWPAVKKNLADQTLNAVGLILAGIAIFAAKQAVYSLFGVKDVDAAKPKVSAWDGANAIRELKTSNPDKFAKLVEKNPDIFEGSVPASAKDVTPA